MTYEEREKELCRKCSRKETCPYILRKMEYKCQYLSDMMYGWELGWKDAINKACEWLKFNYVEFTDNSRLGLNINELIKDFKKAMEEQ